MSQLESPFFTRIRPVTTKSKSFNEPRHHNPFDYNYQQQEQQQQQQQQGFRLMPPNEPFSRQSSNLSTGSASSVSSTGSNSARLKKKKATVWVERHDHIVVVIGPLKGPESFKSLIDTVRLKCGEIKSHYFREEHDCGFFYFYNENEASNCKMIMQGSIFEGLRLKALAPSQYFDNEEDAYPDPAKQKKSSALSQSFGLLSSTDPTTTLVIKNLTFSLRHDKLLDFLGSLQNPPQSVSYHYDNNGLFRGVAFAKYLTAEQAAGSLNELNGKVFDGRELRVEFKRRPGIQSNFEQNTPSYITNNNPPPNINMTNIMNNNNNNNNNNNIIASSGSTPVHTFVPRTAQYSLQKSHSEKIKRIDSNTITSITNETKISPLTQSIYQTIKSSETKLVTKKLSDNERKEEEEERESEEEEEEEEQPELEQELEELESVLQSGENQGRSSSSPTLKSTELQLSQINLNSMDNSSFHSQTTKSTSSSKPPSLASLSFTEEISPVLRAGMEF